MDFIKLPENDVIKIGIKDSKGNDTGEHLEFDLEDFTLLKRLNQMKINHTKNLQYYDNQNLILSKKQDYTPKNSMFTYKELRQIEIAEEFCKKEMETIDLFIGEGKTQMILNLIGRKPYLTMFNDIYKMLKPIMPIIEKEKNKLEDKIKEKYDTKESNILE